MSTFQHKLNILQVAEMNAIEIGANVEVQTENMEASALNSILAEILPFPKAEPRKETKRGRKRRKSAILTDEAEMSALRTEQESAARNKQKKKDNQEARMTKKILAAAAKKSKDASEPQPGCSTGKKPTRSSKKKAPADTESISGSGTAKKTKRGRPKKKQLTWTGKVSQT